jgi:hypothetical protein
MSDLGFGLDVPSLRATEDAFTRDVLTAAKGAVDDATVWLERTLEEVTRAGVPGRLWRAWASEVYPGRGIAQAPSGIVFVNGGARSQGAMEFFTQPGRIVGRSEQWLAIPTPAAGSRGRQRDLTPGQWERQTGIRLRFVYRPGKAALLVADEGTTNARTGAFRPITRKRTAADAKRGYVRGAQSVPIFVLVPFVPFRNSVGIDQLIQTAETRLLGDFDRRLDALG